MKISVCLSILFLLYVVSAAGQRNYSVCKVDSAGGRVFIYAKRSVMTKPEKAKKAIAEIEKQYLFNNLSISFFDNTKDCGYMVEKPEMGMNQDSMPVILSLNVKDVPHHWYAEYTQNECKLEYMKSDGSTEVRKTYYLKKDCKPSSR